MWNQYLYCSSSIPAWTNQVIGNCDLSLLGFRQEELLWDAAMAFFIRNRCKMVYNKWRQNTTMTFEDKHIVQITRRVINLSIFIMIKWNRTSNKNLKPNFYGIDYKIIGRNDWSLIYYLWGLDWNPFPPFLKNWSTSYFILRLDIIMFTVS